MSELAATAPETCRNIPQGCPLTNRELHVLQRVADGHSLVEIASEENVTASTVRQQAMTAGRKLGARNTIHTVIRAWQSGWVLIEPSPEEALLARVEQTLYDLQDQLPLTPAQYRYLEAFRAYLHADPFDAEKARDGMVVALDAILTEARNRPK